MKTREQKVRSIIRRILKTGLPEEYLRELGVNDETMEELRKLDSNSLFSVVGTLADEYVARLLRRKESEGEFSLGANGWLYCVTAKLAWLAIAYGIREDLEDVEAIVTRQYAVSWDGTVESLELDLAGLTSIPDVLRTALVSLRKIKTTNEDYLFQLKKGNNGKFLESYWEAVVSTAASGFNPAVYGVELEIEMRGDLTDLSDLGDEEGNTESQMRAIGDYRQREADVRRMVSEHAPFLEGKISLTSDISLRAGIEIIFAPMTIEEWGSHAVDLAKFFRGLSELGYTSADSGRAAMHIHVNRRAMSPLAQDRLDTLVQSGAKTFWFFNSGRMNHVLTRNSNINEDKFYYCPPGVDVDRREKYRALNWLHSGSLELRIFRGTLDPVRFLANIRVFHELVLMAREPVGRWTSAGVVTRLNNLGGYCALMRERGIWDVVPIPDKRRRGALSMTIEPRIPGFPF